MTTFDKHYYEQYAKLTLDNAFPKWRTHFKKVDNPDLQNETDSIGIEVTSSTPKQIREAIAYGQQYLGRKVSAKEEERFWGRMFLTDDRVVYAYSPTKGPVDSDRSPQLVSSLSLKRSAWIEKHYKFFHTRGLYIFAGTGIIDKRMLEKVEKSEDFSFFHIVIINALDRIYYFQDGWKEKVFTDDELKEFNEKALATGKRQ